MQFFFLNLSKKPEKKYGFHNKKVYIKLNINFENKKCFLGSKSAYNDFWRIMC